MPTTFWAFATGLEKSWEEERIPEPINAVPTQIRSNSKPAPGEPSGKVENKRCRVHPITIVRNASHLPEPYNGSDVLTLLRYGAKAIGR